MDNPPELSGVRHEYVDAAGLRVHVALAGPEDAPAIMLVHGWPQNWWAWREVIPPLARRFRVIAADLRGHGWTQAPRSGYEKEQLACDLLAVLDALGVERVTWVGHDWGGWAGFLAALREPARFERMLALCIPHPWTPPDVRQAAVMFSYQTPISLPFFGPMIAGRLARTVLQSGRGEDPLTPAGVEVFAERVAPRVTVALYRTFLTRELVPMARGRYRGEVLQVPTTLIVGARDLVTTGIQSGAVPHQPQLRVQVLDGVAHWVPEQRPQRIVEWAQAA